MRALTVLCVFYSLMWSGEEVAATSPCHIGLRTDITNGTKFSNGSILHNHIMYRPGKYVKTKNGTTIMGCTCDVVPHCFRKCCPHGETYHGKTCEKSNHSLATNFRVPVHKGEDKMPVSTNHFTLVHMNYCEKGAFLLEPDYPEDVHYLQVNGSLYLPAGMGGNPASYSPDQFCMDYFEDQGIVSALLCYPDDEKMQLEYSIGNHIFN